MTDYNRFTTQKGQLLLNINPPSRTYNLDKSGVNLSNSNNSGVPNTPPYKIY